MTRLGYEHGFLEVIPHQPDQRRADRAVVVLLHGTGGSKDDWRFPVHRELHYHHSPPAIRRTDNQWHPPIDLNPFSLSDKRTDIRCWTGVLTALGHTVINYSQDGPNQPVQEALNQFTQHIVPFIRSEVLVGPLADKRVVVLAHSRGGILIRAYLHHAAEAGAEWIEQVVTLCSPHEGTQAPQAKRRLAAYLLAFGIGGVIAYALLDRMGWLDETSAANELLPGDPVFERLAVPAEVPGIGFRTFGGTSVRYAGVYFWYFTLDSYIPNWSDFPDIRFDWTQLPAEIPAVSPLLDAIPDSVVKDEQDEGEGDGAVSDQRSRLPGAPHESFPINHVEALWDEAMFARIADVLGTPLSEAGDVDCGGWDPMLDFNPSAVSFGSVRLGQTARRVVQITNGTGAEVTLSFPASAPGALFRWDAFEATLPDRESTSITLEYHPADTSIRTELLRVTSTAPGSPHPLTMTGKGVGGFPEPGPEPPLPTVLTLPAAVSFGSVPVGGSVERLVVIRNNTGRAVQVDIEASRTGSAFQWLAFHGRIAHAGERRLTIRFQPSTRTVFNGRILVGSDLPSSPAPVALVGKGGVGGFPTPGDNFTDRI